MRRADLIRAVTTIRNTEARLRALVNSPNLVTDRETEIVPQEVPVKQYIRVDMGDALVTALQNRPEIDEAMQEVEAARVRLDMARHELLPVLDVVVETYVSGLRGNYGIGESWVDQFSRGEPSYSAGLLFEVPLYRRAAFARHDRRLLELRQLQQQFQATVELLNAEVEVAVREVETAYRELGAKFRAMLAAEADMAYLQQRWERVPGEDRAASFMLEDLLDAQDRLAAEEGDFARAQANYTLSLTKLKRATGTLLQHQQIEHVQATEDGLPTILFERVGPVEIEE